MAVTLVLGVALRAASALLMTRAALHPLPVAGINGGSGHPRAPLPPSAQRAYWRMATSWDGWWFRSIAAHGYPTALPTHDGAIQHNEWAFLPAYPIAVRWTMHLTGAGFAETGAAIAVASSLAAAILIVVLLTPRVGRWAAVACAVLVMAAPASPTFRMTYSEGPALLILVAVLLALDHQRWLTAAALMLVAGLTRPIAAPLAVVVAVVVVARWRSARPLRAREWIRIASLVAACAVATIAWQVIAWVRTGDFGAYSHTEASWHDADRIIPFVTWLDAARRTVGHSWGLPWLVGLIAVYVAVLVSPVASRLGLALRTWCIAYLLYIGAFSDFVTSDVRFALLLFPLPAVLIGAAARHRPPRSAQIAAAVIVAVAFLTLQVFWINDLLRPTTVMQPV